MSAAPDPDVSASGQSSPRCGAVLFGYSSDHQAELLRLLEAEGLQGRVADLADSAAEQTRTTDITVVLLKLSGKAGSDRRVVERARKSFPLAGIILTSIDPESDAQLANRLQADDLVTCRDKQRLLLAIRRESRNGQMRRDLREARQELVRGEELLGDLLEPSEHPIAYLRNGLHVSANAAYCRYWGEEPRQLHNRALLDLVSPDPESRASLQLSLDQAILEGRARNVIDPKTQDHSRAEIEFSGIQGNGINLVRLKIGSHATHAGRYADSNRLSRETPAAVAAPLSVSAGRSGNPRSGIRELQQSRIFYKPIVSLDGDTTENYIAVPVATEFAERLTTPPDTESGGKTGPSRCTSGFIREAIEQLAQWDGRNRLHLAMPDDVLTAEKMLASICDSLRKFKASGRDLYFHVDESRLRQNDGEFGSILEKFRKINCRIACRGVGTGPSLPSLLQRHGVKLVHFSGDVERDLGSETLGLPDFRELNRSLQELGFRTLIGNVNDRGTLMKCWNIGVNYVWGSLFPAPTARFGSNRPPGRK